MIDSKTSRNYIPPLVLAILTLVFGILGFLKESYGIATLSAFETYIYKTIQLLQFEFDPDSHACVTENLYLGIARWAGTFTTLWVILTIYIEFILQSAKQRRAKRWKKHAIVCGYGQIGKKLVQSLLQDKFRVVVIDPNMDIDQFPLNDVKKCTFIPQNAELDIPLKNAGIHGARYLFAVTGDDIQNFEILSQAKSIYNGKKRRSAIQAYAHVDNYELIHDVHDFALFKNENNTFHAQIFNADTIAARLIIEKNAPDIYKPITSVDAPPLHILVAGFGIPARALLTEMARTCHFLNDVQNKITVLDEKIENPFNAYKGRFQNIDKVINLDFYSCRPDCLKAEDIASIEENQTVDIVYIYHDDSTVEFLAMKRLRQLFGEGVPIVLCLQQKTALPEYTGKDSNIFLSKAFEQATDYKSIMQEPLEKLSQKFHERYLKDQKVNFNDPTTQTKESHVHWDELSEEFKQSNKSLAAHIDIKLRAVNLVKRNLDDTKQQVKLADFDKSRGLNALENKTIVDLANMEHRRWNADRFMAGWIYDKQRNDNHKKHPDLKSWAELNDQVKMYDVDAILAIAEILAECGKGIYPSA